MKNVALGMPVFGGGVPGEAIATHFALVADMVRNGINVFCILPVDITQNKSREFVWQQAQILGCDEIMSVDADMILPPQTYTRLAATMRETQAAVVSGHYYMRGAPYNCVWAEPTPTGGKYMEAGPLEDPRPIMLSGLGCALIDCKQFVSFELPMFQTWLKGMNCIGEDTYFFRRAYEAGLKVIGDPKVRCGHLHTRIQIDDTSVDQLRKQNGCEIRKSEDAVADAANPA